MVRQRENDGEDEIVLTAVENKLKENEKVRGAEVE